MSDLPSIRRTLDQVMARDFGRLLARWRRLAAARPSPAPDQVAALQADIAASVARRATRPGARAGRSASTNRCRSARGPTRSSSCIREHQVVVLAGETGSGKTTQLPKICLAAGRGVAGHDRPHAAAAHRRARGRARASRGARHAGRRRWSASRCASPIRCRDASLIKFMTDGILLAETQSRSAG